MKIRKHSFLLAILLIMAVFSGCSLRDTLHKIDKAENKIEQKVEDAENKVEDAIIPKNNPSVKPDAKISSDKAQDISLKHAGLTAEQVTGLYAKYEIDDIVPHYDVQFRHNQWEYEYEINAETGEIMTFEKED